MKLAGDVLFVLPLVGHDGLDGIARPGNDLPAGIKDPSTLFVYALQPVRHATLLRSTRDQSDRFELAESTIERTHYNPPFPPELITPFAERTASRPSASLVLMFIVLLLPS